MNLGRMFKTIGRVIAIPVTAPVKVVTRGAQKTMQAAIMGVIRHILTTVGGGLVVSGALSGDELNQAIGAIVTLAGIAWSVISKRKSTPA